MQGKSSTGAFQNFRGTLLKPARRAKITLGGLSGRPVGRSGGLYRRVALTKAARCKLPPGVSRKNTGASLGFSQCFSLQFRPDLPCFWCYGGTELRLNLFKNDTFTLLFHSYDISNIFNGYFIFFLSCQKNSVGLLTQRGLFFKQCYFFPIFSL